MPEDRNDLPHGARTAIDFNTYQAPAELGIDMPVQAASCVLGISEEQFLARLAALEREVAEDAQRLLQEADLAAAVDRLPVPDGGLALAVGDSLTTYRRSYFELLRHMTTLRRPEAGIRFANRAQSGYTSVHALRSTYSQYVRQAPDLVTVCLGGNDGQRYGEPAERTLVSIGEYRDNVEGIILAFHRHTSARVILLSPAPVAPGRVRNVPGFAASRLSYDNVDRQVCADALRSLALQYGLPFVDLVEAFGEDPDPDLYYADGVHPGPSGQELILRHLLELW